MLAFRQDVEMDSEPLPTTAVTAERSRLLADFVALTKPRVNLLVLVTTVIGFHLGNRGGTTDLALLVNTVVGTFLVASGAAAFNQVLERDVDARMHRTMMRPLPDRRITLLDATLFAVALSVIGVLQLAFGANGLAASVAAITLASYVLVYTPLKRITSLATVIGAVPGALPPLIGWAAAHGTLTLEAWVLFAIVFFWQMPHVLAVSWVYRDDYQRGGIRVLPVEDPGGRRTAFQMVNYAAALVPVSLMPTIVGLAGRIYFVGAIVLGVGLLMLAIRFAQDRSAIRAKRLFLASLAYLPVLWVLMLANHG
jgi:protoheme IX farnesyltransferase